MGIGIKVAFDGSKKAFQRRMKTAEKKVDKELRKQMRTAAKIVRKQVRANFKAQYGSGGASFTARKVAFSVKVRRRKGVQTAYAWIGWRFRSMRHNKQRESGSWQIPMAYTPYLEHGGTMSRRPGAKRRRAHTARYRGKPFFEPAVKQTERKVFDLLGRTLNVI